MRGIKRYKVFDIGDLAIRSLSGNVYQHNFVRAMRNFVFSHLSSNIVAKKKRREETQTVPHF